MTILSVFKVSSKDGDFGAVTDTMGDIKILHQEGTGTARIDITLHDATNADANYQVPTDKTFRVIAIIIANKGDNLSKLAYSDALDSSTGAVVILDLKPHATGFWAGKGFPFTIPADKYPTMQHDNVSSGTTTIWIIGIET